MLCVEICYLGMCGMCYVVVLYFFFFINMNYICIWVIVILSDSIRDILIFDF